MGKATKYDSDIILGERYRDEQTGYEGVATSVTFFQHACERVCIENYDAGRKEVKEAMFDAPRLTHVSSGRKATTERTGGPGPDNARPGSNSR